MNYLKLIKKEIEDIVINSELRDKVVNTILIQGYYKVGKLLYMAECNNISIEVDELNKLLVYSCVEDLGIFKKFYKRFKNIDVLGASLIKLDWESICKMLCDNNPNNFKKHRLLLENNLIFVISPKPIKLKKDIDVS